MDKRKKIHYLTTRDNFTRNFSTDRQQGSNPETELRRREILKEKTIDHQNVVANIWELYQTSLTVKTDDSSYDLLVLTPRYAILHEIKTITPQNERKQIRHAVGQLLYYEHFNVPYELQSSHLEVKKILVLSCQPHDAEHLTFLASLGIGTIWFNENGQLDGEETVEFLQPFLS